MRGGRRLRHAASRFHEQTTPEEYNHHEVEEYREWIECVRANGSLPACDHLLSDRTRLRLLQADSGDALFRLVGEGEGGTVNDTVEVSSGNNASTMVDYSADEEQLRNLYKVVMPVMLTACVISLLFNLVIVISVRWVRKKTLSPTLYLSLSLAAADAWASLVLGLGFVLNSLLPVVYGVTLGAFNQCFVLVLEAFRLGALVVAVLHLLALAVNHYVGILRPLHYAATVTRGTVLWAVAAMWVAPFAFFLAYFSLVPGDGFQAPRCSRYEFLLRGPFRATVSALFFAPLLLMSAMYGHMFAVVRRHQRGPQLQVPAGRQLHKSVKAVITTLLILGTYLLGWMPAVLYFVLTCLECPVPFTGIPLWTRVPVGIFINSMIVAKSFADPIIYVARMPEIKQALRSIGRTRCGLRAEVEQAEGAACSSKTEINRLTTRRVKEGQHSPVNGCPGGDT